MRLHGCGTGDAGVEGEEGIPVKTVTFGPEGGGVLATSTDFLHSERGPRRIRVDLSRVSREANSRDAGENEDGAVESPNFAGG